MDVAVTVLPSFDAAPEWFPFGLGWRVEFSLSLATWLILTVPMPVILALVVVTYLSGRRDRRG